MYATRIPAIGALPKSDDPKGDVGWTGAKLEGLIAPSVQWKAHNYNHLHEAPTVFYAVALVLALLNQGDGISLMIAWAYVAHTDGAFDADLLAGFLAAYQETRSLDLSEMWALPTTLRVVLIENQLEGSDHTHLCQIMTYLAGLETHTMIWVAPNFRDEHLSAIRWLNEHTVDPFAFFAVRVRVVKVGESPLAPLFEVVERPNNWDRQVAQQKREVEGHLSDLGQHRREFWTHFCSRHPVYGKPAATSSMWATLPVV
jgi:hypothetical protein